MSTQLKLRRGTTAQHSTFTGAEGEITVDTTKNTVVVHDGTTAGGIPLAKESALSGYVSTSGGVISANTSTDALRITQTGTGNALVVEDSANPDSSPFVINTSGQVLIGTTTNNTYAGVSTSPLQLSGLTQGTATSVNSIWIAGSAPAVHAFSKSRSGAIGTHTIVQDGDVIGNLTFEGSDGTAFIQSATIRALVDGTPGTNDMPGRLVFSTTADGASTPTERMRITSAGLVGIGQTPSITTGMLRVSPSATGGTVVNNIVANSTIASDVTTFYGGVVSSNATAASAFTLASARHFSANGLTIGVGSTVTNQYGFWADSALTGATNNYGFYSNIASGTGRWNFYAAGSADNYFAGNVGIGTTTLNPLGTSTALSLYGAATTSITLRANSATGGYLSTDGVNYVQLFAQASGASLLLGTNNTERMRIDSAGKVGIGSTSLTGFSLRVGGSITGATSAYGIGNTGTVQSDVTTAAQGIRSAVATAAASFTVPELYQFVASQGTFGAGSTVTTQYGFHASSSLTGATNNYGFYSAIASGTGRYNFYAAGSAANYFAGNTQIANYLDVTTVNAAGFGLRVRADAADTYAGIQFTNTAVSAQWAKITSPAANVLSFQDGGSVEKMRIDSSGNLIQSAPTTAPTLSTNGTLVFNLTSNTNLRVSVRGSDGVTRTANITLA